MLQGTFIHALLNAPTLHGKWLLTQKYQYLEGHDLLLNLSMPINFSVHFSDSPPTFCWTSTPSYHIFFTCVNCALIPDTKMPLNLQFTVLILGPTFFQFAFKRNKLIHTSEYDTSNAKFEDCKFIWWVRRDLNGSIKLRRNGGRG